MFDLTRKVALVTGSTKGIGRAIAEEMARHGAKVVICSRSAQAVTDTVAQLSAAGHAAIGEPCDVTVKADVERLVAKVLAEWGRIDILVCNAGSNGPHGPMTALADDAYDQIFDLNVRSVIRLANLVLPQMAERRDGALIVISSIAALRGSNKTGIYGVTKAAENALVRSLAVEWGPSNIRVNSIMAAVIETDMSKRLFADKERLAKRLSITPLKRVGQPRDIAGIAVFLASEAGSYVTGQAIAADGGASIGWD